MSFFYFPPLSSSDHYSLLFIVLLRQYYKPSSKNLRSIWLYSKGDFKSANLILSTLPSDSLLSSTDVNYSWSIFKEVFIEHEVMNHTILSKLLPIKSHRPGLTTTFFYVFSTTSFFVFSNVMFYSLK